MFNYIKPLRKKYPDNVIVHISTNDAVNIRKRKTIR